MPDRENSTEDGGGDEVPVEIRGTTADDATVENIWIAGQPIGILLKKLGERVATLEDENEALREELDMAAKEAQSAMGMAEAKARADGSMASKKERILQVVRNDLVDRAGDGRKKRVTLKDTRRLCRPQISPHNQEIYRAWDELTVRWNCFKRDTDPNGNQCLVVQPSRISDRLKHAVTAELSKEQVSNSVVTGHTTEGG